MEISQRKIGYSSRLPSRGHYAKHPKSYAKASLRKPVASWGAIATGLYNANCRGSACCSQPCEHDRLRKAYDRQAKLPLIPYPVDLCNGMT